MDTGVDTGTDPDVEEGADPGASAGTGARDPEGRGEGAVPRRRAARRVGAEQVLELDAVARQHPYTLDAAGDHLEVRAHGPGQGGVGSLGWTAHLNGGDGLGQA
mgnify:CR=1 FL=1